MHANRRESGVERRGMRERLSRARVEPRAMDAALEIAPHEFARPAIVRANVVERADTIGVVDEDCGSSSVGEGFGGAFRKFAYGCNLCHAMVVYRPVAQLAERPPYTRFCCRFDSYRADRFSFYPNIPYSTH